MLGRGRTEGQAGEARAHAVRLALAGDAHREQIFRVRHEVYARELRQHAPTPDGRLEDALDARNRYVVAVRGDRVVGFVSFSSAAEGSLGIDKYLAREVLPFGIDDATWEIRILTVLPAARRGPLAALLMWAALRQVQVRGGTRIVAMGRSDLLRLYEGVGLQRCDLHVRSGALSFELLTAWVSELAAFASARWSAVLRRGARDVEWGLDVPMFPPRPCPHGGASFEVLGAGFEHLDRRTRIVPADVLDAWFPPAPRVVEALRREAAWLAGTSPPADAGGLVRAIARARGVPESSLVVAAGSSPLIFTALPAWLGPRSRALLLDPSYGEYGHVLERVVGCRVECLPLRRGEGYVLDPDRLRVALDGRPDLAVIVNPNNPTGRHVPRVELEAALSRAPRSTIVWVDEAYVDYVDPGESLEAFAAASSNVVVCKSMSKAYALSGLRVGYLCGPPAVCERLRGLLPPWSVSLPAQMAAVVALEETAYYAARWEETARLRQALEAELREIPGLDVVPGRASFLLVHLPEDGPDAAALIAACRREGVFLRSAAGMGRVLGPRALRLAVRAPAEAAAVTAALRHALAAVPT